MEKHIKEYLLEYNQVQVTDFGSFKVEYKSSYLHPILHTFSVPGKYVVFTENKKSDDDFAFFIAKKEKISIEEAKNRIGNWVQEVWKTINEAKKQFSVSTLGSFFLNAMGRIEFAADLDTDVSPQSFGLKEFKAKLPAQKTDKTDKIDKVDKIGETDKIEGKGVPLRSPENDSPTPTLPKGAGVSPFEGGKGDVSFGGTKGDLRSPEKQEEAIDKIGEIDKIDKVDKIEEIEEPVEESNEEEITPTKRKKRVGLWVLFIFLLVCGVFIWVSYLAFPKTFDNCKDKTLDWFNDIKAKIITQKEVQPLPAEVVVEEATAIESNEDIYTDVAAPAYEETQVMSSTNVHLTSDPSQMQAQKQTPPTAAVQSGNYYVVIGSFRENANADKFLKEKTANYSNAVNLGMGKSGYYMIGIGPYSEQEAESKQKEIPHAWVFKK